ncbi:MAG: helix-turn-helix transcriptional regulator [bacterium]
MKCKQISYEIVDKLCVVLNCRVGDILHWIPDEGERNADN